MKTNVPRAVDDTVLRPRGQLAVTRPASVARPSAPAAPSPKSAPSPSSRPEGPGSAHPTPTSAALVDETTRAARRPLPIVSLALLVACAGIALFADGWILRPGVVLTACAAAALSAIATRALAREIADARKLRNYRLVERLGKGGMGEVWRAEHHLLPRPAAIKFIRPEAFGTAQEHQATVQRFLEEARATVSLSSPHTIEIYDFGVTEDGTLCYVMEFLDGVDLETLVREHGPLPANRVVYILRQACISLAEAHERDFVHRDIKPANLYVCRKGLHFDFVKVLDFGIAAHTRAGGTDAKEAFEIVGTPTYLAPETLRGQWDARSDLYSLGCVAYALLTGQPVFSGRTVTEIVTHHARTRPMPPSQRLGRPVPRDLEIAVLRCLAKKPEDRFASASELSQALAKCDVGPIWTPGQAMTWWREVRGAS